MIYIPDLSDSIEGNFSPETVFEELPQVTESREENCTYVDVLPVFCSEPRDIITTALEDPWNGVLTVTFNPSLKCYPIPLLSIGSIAVGKVRNSSGMVLNLGDKNLSLYAPRDLPQGSYVISTPKMRGTSSEFLWVRFKHIGDKLVGVFVNEDDVDESGNGEGLLSSDEIKALIENNPEIEIDFTVLSLHIAVPSANLHTPSSLEN